jgi:hypothetical protein
MEGPLAGRDFGDGMMAPRLEKANLSSAQPRFQERICVAEAFFSLLQRDQRFEAALAC